MNQRRCSEDFIRIRQLCGISNNICELNFISCAALFWKWLSGIQLQREIPAMFTSEQKTDARIASTSSAGSCVLCEVWLPLIPVADEGNELLVKSSLGFNVEGCEET